MTKNIVIGVLVVASLLFGYGAYGHAHLAGVATGPQHRQIEQFTAGLVIGERGSEVKALFKGNCVIVSSANTIAASSSATVECLATGARLNDDVIVTVSTSSSLSVFGGLTVTGQNASSTSNYVTLKLYNGTGATFTWTAVASSTGFRYRVIR